jgi:LSD1 subclass zinc finger protein
VVVVAAGSLVARHRHARGVGRQQLRWVALGAGLAALALLVAVAFVAVSNDGMVAAATGTCVTLLPLAIGASILRCRLCDIDASSAAPSPTRC